MRRGPDGEGKAGLREKVAAVANGPARGEAPHPAKPVLSVGP